MKSMLVRGATMLAYDKYTARITKIYGSFEVACKIIKLHCRGQCFRNLVSLPAACRCGKRVF